MKWWMILVGLVLSFSRLAVASDKPKVTKESVIKAITVFREDPTSDQGLAARWLIVNFSNDSPDIAVKITEKSFPISTLKLESASEEVRLTLLAAFIVGNVDSQLRSGLKKEDSYAGDLQLIQTYRQLQKRHPKLRIQGIEKLAELQTRGKLKPYLSTE